MESAVQAVLDPKQPMPYREACKTFGVKLTTLHRQVNNCKVNGNSETFTYTANHDHKKVFSIQEEEDLVQYCITIARMQYGLSKKRMRELAYKFAIAKNKERSSQMARKRNCWGGMVAQLSTENMVIVYLYANRKPQVLVGLQVLIGRMLIVFSKIWMQCSSGRKLGCTKILTLTPDKIATVVNPNVTPEKIANVANPNIVEKLPKKMPIKKRKNVPPVEHENEDSLVHLISQHMKLTNL
ncbi:hypothetical protein U1Q18_049990 [Sarracenia purpurea var. burkii]